MSDQPGLFFHKNFEFSFFVKGETFHVGSLSPRSKHLISNSIKDLSNESIRNRFLGSKKEFSEKELDYLTLIDGWDHYAIGAEEGHGQHRGVAVIRMVRSLEDASEAEVAITVIDEYQNRGLGKKLLRLMVLAAFERKIQRLSFTFLPQNQGIIKLIQSVGNPVKGISSMDYSQMFLELKKIDLERIKEELKPLLPGIETFHLEN